MRSPPLTISDRLVGLRILEISGEPLASSNVQGAARRLWLLAEESSGTILSELNVYALELAIGALGAPSLLGLEESALLFRFVLTAALVAILIGACYQLPLPLPARLLLVGFLIGPYVLGVVPEPGVAEGLIELGALLLLFVLGASLRQEQLVQSRLYLAAALAYTSLTTLLTALLLIGHGTGWHEALFTGMLVTVSFTPVTAHYLTRRSGALSLWPAAGNMLLIEGLIVVAALLFIAPVSEARAPLEVVTGIFENALLAGALALLVLIFAQRAVPRRCEEAQGSRDRELAWTTLLSLSFGLIVAAALLELPLAVAVLLAGILLSQVRCRHARLPDLRFLRWVAAASFFIPLGMIADLRALVPLLPAVLLIVAALFMASLIAGRLASRLGGWSGQLDSPAFLLMGGVGELAFLLFYEGRRAGLSPGGWSETGEMLFLGVGIATVVLIPGLLKVTRLVEARLRPQRASPAPEQGSPSPKREKLMGRIDPPRRVLTHLKLRRGDSESTSPTQPSVPVCGYGSEGPVLWTILITPGMPAAYVPLSEITRRGCRGLRVIALWHRGAYVSTPPPEHRLQPGDIVLVSDSRPQRRQGAPYFQSLSRD